VNVFWYRPFGAADATEELATAMIAAAMMGRVKLSKRTSQVEEVDSLIGGNDSTRGRLFPRLITKQMPDAFLGLPLSGQF